MHEYSIVASLLDEVDRIVTREAADRVLHVRVQVGEFSGVDADLLQLAFDDVRTGTRCETAELEIHRVPLRAACEVCGAQFSVENFRFLCSACGSDRVTVSDGEKLILESVRLEADE